MTNISDSPQMRIGSQSVYSASFKGENGTSEESRLLESELEQYFEGCLRSAAEEWLRQYFVSRCRGPIGLIQGEIRKLERLAKVASHHGQ